ncbi:MAG: ATP synthase F0 subunit C [Thermoanaerobaculia bacterium]|nr:ATP synthase F0 subunit C [Thermoanaerobaculia bacterium]
MKKLTFLCLAVLALVAFPAFAQETAEKAADHGPNWGMLAAGFAIGVAAFGGSIGQAKAVAAAVSGMARNPGAAGKVQTAMIIGLAFIESLVIYALLIALKGAGIF